MLRGAGFGGEIVDSAKTNQGFAALVSAARCFKATSSERISKASASDSVFSLSMTKRLHDLAAQAILCVFHGRSAEGHAIPCFCDDRIF